MIELAIAEQLLATPAVTALATGGVHQLIVPQHETRPSVRIQLIDQPRRAHLRGYEDIKRSRLQIDAFAQPSSTVEDPYFTLSELADAIDAALGPEPFEAGSPATRVLLVLRDDRRPFEPDEFHNYRMMQDYRIWHQDA